MFSRHKITTDLVCFLIPYCDMQSCTCEFPNLVLISLTSPFLWKVWDVPDVRLLTKSFYLCIALCSILLCILWVSKEFICNDPCTDILVNTETISHEENFSSRFIFFPEDPEATEGHKKIMSVSGADLRFYFPQKRDPELYGASNEALFAPFRPEAARRTSWVFS